MNTAAMRLVAPASLLLAVVLALWNLALFPEPWYDEGLILHVARNLDRFGAYGLIYAPPAVSPYDLQITTGPTIIGPVAAVFSVLGVGLLQARVVSAMYVVLAALGLYAATRLLYGATVAWLAVLLWCTLDTAGPITLRQGLGEAPALASLFWGLFVFTRARRGGPMWMYAAAGLLFGMAILSKGQFGLLLPALALAWLGTRARPGGFPAVAAGLLLVGAILPAGLWQLYQLVSLGVRGFEDHLRGQQAALAASAVVGPLQGVIVSVRYLVLTSRPLMTVVGLAYAWALIARDWRQRTAEHLVLPLFGALWLGWFVGVSSGYDRYSGPLVASASVLLALLLRDVVAALRARAVERSPSARRWWWAEPLYAGVLLLFAAQIGSGVAGALATVIHPPEPAAQEMAAEIGRAVAPTASIETIEWQLDILVDRPFHHPPPFVPQVAYDVPDDISYLVDGPWSKSIDLYHAQLEQHAYERVATAGSYVLYQRTPRVTSLQPTLPH